MLSRVLVWQELATTPGETLLGTSARVRTYGMINTWVVVERLASWQQPLETLSWALMSQSHIQRVNYVEYSE